MVEDSLKVDEQHVLVWSKDKDMYHGQDVFGQMQVMATINYSCTCCASDS